MCQVRACGPVASARCMAAGAAAAGGAAGAGTGTTTRATATPPAVGRITQFTLSLAAPVMMPLRAVVYNALARNTELRRLALVQRRTDRFDAVEWSESDHAIV